jgi:hypothetical protein
MAAGEACLAAARLGKPSALCAVRRWRVGCSWAGQAVIVTIQTLRIRHRGRAGLAVDAFFAVACTAHALAVADAWADMDLAAMPRHMRCYQMGLAALSALLAVLFLCTNQEPGPIPPGARTPTEPTVTTSPRPPRSRSACTATGPPLAALARAIARVLVVLL